MGKGHVCHLPFEDHDLSLLSTKHVVLRTNYSTERTYHKQSIQTQSNKQTIERCLFNNLDLLRCYDRKIWQRKYEL
jgi:hypothetical protein